MGPRRDPPPQLNDRSPLRLERSSMEGIAMSLQSTARVKRVEKITAFDDQNPRPLLYTRQQVARLFQCSVMTVIHGEQDGRLRSFKLMPDVENARVYIRAGDVTALIEKSSAPEAA